MVDVHFNLGLLAAQREDYATAATHFARCAELKADGAVYREWGQVLVKMGDLPAAADIYRSAVGLDADDLSSLHNLAEVLLVFGESELAQGRQARAAELWGEAREALQKVLALDPGNARAERRLQQLRERLP
jgi:tetratricopeptide (TPR) repeat protein